MLKRLAGIASRVLFFGATVLEAFAAPDDERVTPEELDDLVGLLTPEALDMVVPRIPRPPKTPVVDAPLVGSLEWRQQKHRPHPDCRACDWPASRCGNPKCPALPSSAKVG